MFRGIWRGWGGGVGKNQPFRTPQKKRIRKRTKKDADKSDKCTDGHQLSSETLLPVLNDQ
jgi:hypothetical protein